jgi:hypothetical protein
MKLPPGWSSFTDPSTGHLCYCNDLSGETTWEAPVGAVELTTFENPMKQNAKKKKARGDGQHRRNSTKVPRGWDKLEDGNGERYYEHESGETSWNPPEGSTGGRADAHQTQCDLPPDWVAENDGEGNTYYVHTVTGATTWDKPELGGSVKAEHGHQRNGTVMPPGWAKDFTDEGDGFYIGPDGSTSWDKPPGN